MTLGKGDVMLDEYGCADWNPSKLPDNESSATQEEKRTWLCAQYLGPDNNEEKVKEYMNITYSSQRWDINRRKKTIEQVINAWPYLKKPQYFFQHANRLLGKDVKKTWGDQLNKYYKLIFKFMRMQAAKLRRAQSKQEKKRLEEIKDIVKNAKTCAENLQSEAPFVLSILQLITAYFGEAFQHFVSLQEETVTVMDIEKIEHDPQPYLVVAGKDIYQENVQAFVVVEKKVIMTTSTVLEGVLCVFLCYFNFLLEYHSHSATLEFIQRFLLQINPTSGNRRSKNNRTTVHPKVFSLMQRLEEFSEWDLN